MQNNDTIYLLKECDSGSKMAVASIDEVLDHIHDSNMKEILIDSKKHHEALGNELHSLLLERGSDDKDPSIMAKSMSWLKTNMKITMDESDATVADLMIDGCNMGVKSLYRYLNQYPGADKIAKDICMRLVDIEEKLCKDLRVYL